jgi:hypothetical protein
VNIPDLINGSFELVGAIALWSNVVKLRKDRRVAGVYWPATAFFAVWGLWNCFYYPWLGQWASFVGGVLITMANIVWAALAFHYSKQRSIPNPNWVSVEPDAPDSVPIFHRHPSFVTKNGFRVVVSTGHTGQRFDGDPS